MIPLCYRTYRGHSHTQVVAVYQEKPPKYKNWDEDTMINAYLAVNEGWLSINHAASTYGVPSSTGFQEGLRQDPIVVQLGTSLIRKEKAKLVSYLDVWSCMNGIHSN